MLNLILKKLAGTAKCFKTRPSVTYARPTLEWLENRVLLASWVGGGPNSNWTTRENWLAKIVPGFDRDAEGKIKDNIASFPLGLPGEHNRAVVDVPIEIALLDIGN